MRKKQGQAAGRTEKTRAADAAAARDVQPEAGTTGKKAGAAPWGKQGRSPRLEFGRIGRCWFGGEKKKN
jgi:hypothetical protein